MSGQDPPQYKGKPTMEEISVTESHSRPNGQVMEVEGAGRPAAPAPSIAAWGHVPTGVPVLESHTWVLGSV
ncbi:hypothetical protein GCM10029978_080030 [Actinoallomurus acanthiterrae]